MVDKQKRGPQHLETKKDPVWWDWWSENPIEVVLVLFILVLFFALPRQGCGVTAADQPNAGDSAPIVQE
jgi:hypothetical protein